MFKTFLAAVTAAAASIVQPADAEAQSRPAQFSLGAAAGIASPFHGDFDFKAASWELSGRGRPTDHLTIEAFGSSWHHTSNLHVIGLPAGNASGSLGVIGDLTQRTRHQAYSFGASVLPTFTVGRATIVAGGGPNVMFYQRSFEQRFENCTPSSSATCGGYATSRSTSDLGVHALAGLDVPFGRRLLAFGQYRVIVPVRDPGAGHGALLAGVRVAVR